MERGFLTSLFEKYFPSLMQRHNEFRRITPMTDMAMIQMTCYLLECLLDNFNEQVISNDNNVNQANSPRNAHNLHHAEMNPDVMEMAYELIFIYATMWGFGSALYQDHIIDWHREFHKWWISEFKDIKLPPQGSIFDYCLDVQKQKFIKWEEMWQQQDNELDTFDADTPLQNILIPTVETTRLNYMLKMLIDRNIACMLVGNAGCGKGAIFRELFNKYTNAQEMYEISLIASPTPAGNDGHIRTNIQQKHRVTIIQSTYFNFYTSSEIFQKVLDRPLEKKSGRSYGPAGPNRRLLYFVNDLNMPEVDEYGTVQPHTIMRQFMDYRQW